MSKPTGGRTIGFKKFSDVTRGSSFSKNYQGRQGDRIFIYFLIVFIYLLICCFIIIIISFYFRRLAKIR